METNIHFPTDYNLLWDSARKCLDILDVCSRLYDFAGWRKLAAWRSELKNLSRAVGKASSFTHKNKERAIVQAAQDYVDKAKKLEKKISESVFENWETIVQDIELSTLIEKDLVFFLSMLTKHIDLVERRLIRKEVIASSEKIHSIFELHTEWISKGKLNKAIELGHNLLISTDQFGFILRSKVVEKQSDSQLVLALADDLLLRYTNKIERMSFDKGFYSQENKTLLSFAIEKVILPKKGKRCAAQQAEESAKEFKKLRYAHSAIESNINQLEHHGLNRCPDKGFHRYKTYVSLGILSYNLCKLGKIILAKQANATPQASQVWQQAA